MELVAVKIKGTTITARYGTLGTGDILRTDAAFAKHLVEDCKAAEYVQPTAPPPPANADPVPSPKARVK
jgi:hypothetical protein